MQDYQYNIKKFKVGDYEHEETVMLPRLSHVSTVMIHEDAPFFNVHMFGSHKFSVVSKDIEWLKNERQKLLNAWERFIRQDMEETRTAMLIRECGASKKIRKIYKR